MNAANRAIGRLGCRVIHNVLRRDIKRNYGWQVGSRHRLHSASEMLELGKRIAAARSKAGLTQKETAEHFGRSHTLIVKIESGDRQVTALELRDLCRLFGVPIADVVDL